MDGVDQQAWKDALRLRSEGQWSQEMSSAGHLPRVHPCRPAPSFPLSEVSSVSPAKGAPAPHSRDVRTPRDGNMDGNNPVGLLGVFAAEVLGAEGWAKLQRVQTFSCVTEKELSEGGRLGTDTLGILRV